MSQQTGTPASPSAPEEHEGNEHTLFMTLGCAIAFILTIVAVCYRL